MIIGLILVSDYINVAASSSPDTSFYYPKNRVKQFHQEPLHKRSIANTLLDQQNFMAEELDVDDKDLAMLNTLESTEAVVTYCQRVIDDIPVINHNCGLVVKDGEVQSYYSSFASNDYAVQSEKKLSEEEAVSIAENKYGAPKDEVPIRLVYVETIESKLVLAYQFQIKNITETKWAQVSVDASNGDIVEYVDYIQLAQYNVIPNPKRNPYDGFELLKDPQNLASSPKGWHSDGVTNWTTTQGNNVVAIDYFTGKIESQTSPDLIFQTNWDIKFKAYDSINKRASVVNLFYLNNYIHDVLYPYGFDEASGNFQLKNYGGSTGDKDQLYALSQYNCYNNAYFATPPDGQNPIMFMCPFFATSPSRDTSLENSIIMHEYFHGVSNRLTGGKDQVNCLASAESRGMGEGWSDAFAMFMQRKLTDTGTDVYVLGDYVLDNQSGIRYYPYTTDISVNPWLFSSLKSVYELHKIGEIWATIMNEMYWQLVDKFGFSANWYDVTQSQGNIKALRIMVTALKLQPCNPTFIQARDAILLASFNLYGKQNDCLLWKAFAKRGLGTDANGSKYADGFSLPNECIPRTTSTVIITTLTRTTSTPIPNSTTIRSFTSTSFSGATSVTRTISSTSLIPPSSSAAVTSTKIASTISQSLSSTILTSTKVSTTTLIPTLSSTTTSTKITTTTVQTTLKPSTSVGTISTTFGPSSSVVISSTTTTSLSASPTLKPSISTGATSTTLAPTLSAVTTSTKISTTTGQTTLKPSTSAGATSTTLAPTLSAATTSTQISPTTGQTTLKPSTSVGATTTTLAPTLSAGTTSTKISTTAGQTTLKPSTSVGATSTTLVPTLSAVTTSTKISTTTGQTTLKPSTSAITISSTFGSSSTAVISSIKIVTTTLQPGSTTLKTPISSSTLSSAWTLSSSTVTASTKITTTAGQSVSKTAQSASTTLKPSTSTGATSTTLKPSTSTGATSTILKPSTSARVTTTLAPTLSVVTTSARISTTTTGQSASTISSGTITTKFTTSSFAGITTVMITTTSAQSVPTTLKPLSSAGVSSTILASTSASITTSNKIATTTIQARSTALNPSSSTVVKANIIETPLILTDVTDLCENENRNCGDDCCSQFGYCGSSDEHCGAGCNVLAGRCY